MRSIVRPLARFVPLSLALWALAAPAAALGPSGTVQEESEVAALEEEAESLEARIDSFWGAKVNGPVGAVFFFDVWFWDDAWVDGEPIRASRPGKVSALGAEMATIAWADGGTAEVQLTHLRSADRVLGHDVAVPQEGVLVSANLEADTGLVRWPDGLEDELPLGGVTATTKITLPLTVLWLIAGALFFTVRMGFINLRGFAHAIQVTRGKFDHPGDEGEVSHFQALSAALSATVGLGNIAGVAIAVGTGGPGATFWMILAGLLGMSSKFTECTLGQMYRERRPDGRVMGGAMFYLSKGLAEKKLAGLGKFLAVSFAILCIGGSLAGGNAFQVNQSLDAIGESFPALLDYRWVYGLIMTALVGIVILGGIQSIAAAASKIVPLMCVIYVLAALFILISKASEVPAAFGVIIDEAFSANAMYGGFLGVLITGFKRAAFSNEAGVGSAAIAHSAARTEYPVREGIVALLEPFIDTVVICTMTALVIVITGAYSNPEYTDLVASNNGAALTSRAMAEVIPFMPGVLSIAVVLFAFSTMISWSYYGERCWAWMFGDKSSPIYRVLFLTFVFLGSILSAKNVLEFGDLMILGMALPNILGVVLLSGKVRAALTDYWGKKTRGELQTYD